MSGAPALEIPVEGTRVIVRWELAGTDQVDVGLKGDGDDASPDVVSATVATIQEISAGHRDRAIRLIGSHPADRVLPLPALVAAALDLQPTRELHQLRRPLPVGHDDPGRADVPSLRLRPFRPGQDEDAWLRVNNAAFASHPDQGGQTLASLQATLAEPWVDLDGFLVTDDPDDPDELAGFCWTRIHAASAEDPVLGEIFAIGVAPAHHGKRLGATLVLAGLDHLSWSGVETGMLYVEGDNGPALKLYARLGFQDHLIMRMFA